MEITEVRINPSKGGRVRAFASIVIDDCFIVNDLRVMEGREGQLFVTMPARKIRNGQMRDIAHPLTSEARRTIEESVLAEYRQAVTNLVIGGGRPQSDRKEQRMSPLARLASKLFSEDYWSSEQPTLSQPQARSEKAPRSQTRSEKAPRSQARSEKPPRSEKQPDRRSEKRPDRGSKPHGRGHRVKRKEETAEVAD